jgi:prepilin-type N-terminal cleavage/methylation domain-containing protein
MMKKIFKTLRSEKGFTLIELLVVIAILGAIAGVVVLNVGGFIGRGECEGYCTEKHNIQTAVIASCTENGTHSDYESYLIGDPMFTWSPSGCGEVSDASDAPSGCDCLSGG